MLALAVCHNVTPIIDRDSHPEASEHPMEQSGVAGASEEEDTVLFSRERGEDSEEGGQDSRAGGRGDDTVTRHISYQASSPDEVRSSVCLVGCLLCASCHYRCTLTCGGHF